MEGSISDIWDDKNPPGYTLTHVNTANQTLHVLYWGGPTRDWRNTAPYSGKLSVCRACYAWDLCGVSAWICMSTRDIHVDLCCVWRCRHRAPRADVLHSEEQGGR